MLRRIFTTTKIFEAWSEEKWSINGAAVDVSLICFGASDQSKLNGSSVDLINADLTSGVDLSQTRDLAENKSLAYLGIQKSGPFDVDGSSARVWLQEPINVNGRYNSDVLRPYWNGDDLTSRPRDKWLIDLPIGMSEADASQFSAPFQHLMNATDENGFTVKELRLALGDRAGPRWWEPHWPRPEMRSKIATLPRYIVTPETSQHRIFAWLSHPILPDKNLIVFPREDDLMFGLLQNRFHCLWARRKGSDLQDRPRYTHTSVVLSFPFPRGMEPIVPVADALIHPLARPISDAAKRLNELRDSWLNPSNLIRREPEIVSGYPDRLVPVDDHAAQKLRARTLTNLYNENPPWLTHAHRALDEAVAAAYGWAADEADDAVLARLFALNEERAAKQ